MLKELVNDAASTYSSVATKRPKQSRVSSADLAAAAGKNMTLRDVALETRGSAENCKVASIFSSRPDLLTFLSLQGIPLIKQSTETRRKVKNERSNDKS